MIKHRASFRHIWPRQAWMIDLSGARYVFGHPAWWARKGIRPDCHLDHNLCDRSKLAIDMRIIFHEHIAEVIRWPRPSDVAEEIIRASKAAEKARIAEAGGYIELFG